jgi:hypothetical protein
MTRYKDMGRGKEETQDMSKAQDEELPEGDEEYVENDENDEPVDGQNGEAGLDEEDEDDEDQADGEEDIGDEAERTEADNIDGGEANGQARDGEGLSDEDDDAEADGAEKEDGKGAKRKPAPGSQPGSAKKQKTAANGLSSSSSTSHDAGAASPNKVGSRHDEPRDPSTQGSAGRLPRQGQQVHWKALPGYVDGEVVEVLTESSEVEGHSVKASEDDPRIVLKSNKSGKIVSSMRNTCFFFSCPLSACSSIRFSAVAGNGSAGMSQPSRHLIYLSEKLLTPVSVVCS